MELESMQRAFSLIHAKRLLLETKLFYNLSNEGYRLIVRIDRRLSFELLDLIQTNIELDDKLLTTIL